MLIDESELNSNVVVVIFEVDVMFALGVTIPSEVVRLLAKVLGNVGLPLVLSVVNVTVVDTAFIDVEFTSTGLLAVEGKCEMETWIRLD